MLCRLPEQIPNCEVARHIKHSILQLKYRGEEIETWYEGRHPYNLTSLRTKDALCLFYVKNDSIIYYYVKDYEENFYVVPLYNYRKDSYDIVRVKRDLHILEMDSYVAIVKAPNGKIYGLLDYKYVVRVEDFVEEKIVYHQALESNQYGPYVQYSLPIANSLVVVVKVTEKEVIVNIFDLVKEDKNEIRFHLEKHRDFILEQLPDDSEIRKWVDTRLISREIKPKISGLKYSIGRLNNDTLFYKKVTFEINLRYTRYHERTGEKMYCFIIRSPIITIEYEDDKFIVSMKTGTNAVIKTSDTVFEIRPDVLLEAKEYQLNKEEYDISNSHLYNIFDASGKYEIIKVSSKPSWHIYQKGELTHSVEGSQNIRITRLQNINIMRISDDWFASLTESQAHKMYDARYYVLFTLKEQLKIVDIEKLYNKLRGSGQYGIIIGISNLVTNVDVVNEVKGLLPDLMNSIYGISVKGSKYSFDVKYYLESERRALYFLVTVHVPVDVNTQEKRSFAMIFKKGLDKSNYFNKQPILVWYPNPKWTRWSEIRNSIFLFSPTCFYYASDIIDYGVTISARELQQPGALMQYGIIVTKLNKNGDGRYFYEVKRNRLSNLVHVYEYNPVVCTLSLTKRDKLLNV